MFGDKDVGLHSGGGASRDHDVHVYVAELKCQEPGDRKAAQYIQCFLCCPAWASHANWKNPMILHLSLMSFNSVDQSTSQPAARPTR